MNRLFALLLVSGFLGAQEVPLSLSKATTAFLAAIAADDVAQLAQVARFPIKSNEFKTINSKTELKKTYPAIFTKDRKAGLVGQKPQPRSNGVYSLSSKDQSDPIQFLFKKYNQEYRFYLIDNINE